MKKIKTIFAITIIALSAQSIIAQNETNFWIQIANRAQEVQKMYENNTHPALAIANHFLDAIIDNKPVDAAACIAGGNFEQLSIGINQLATRLITKIPGDTIVRLARGINMNVADTQKQLVLAGDAITKIATTITGLPILFVNAIASDQALRILAAIDILNVAGQINNLIKQIGAILQRTFSSPQLRTDLKKLLDEYCSFIEYEKI